MLDLGLVTTSAEAEYQMGSIGRSKPDCFNYWIKRPLRKDTYRALKLVKKCGLIYYAVLDVCLEHQYHCHFFLAHLMPVSSFRAQYMKNRKIDFP